MTKARTGAVADADPQAGADPVGAADSPTTGSPTTGSPTTESDTTEETATRVWRNLAAVVLERNERRKEIAEALGMSFFRVKALRRIAARPRRMSELATELACDRPYLTLVVDDLVKRGLVERNQHPTDRRCKIVSATAAGQEVAARADAILGAPPPVLLDLPPGDLAALDRIAAVLAERTDPGRGPGPR